MVVLVVVAVLKLLLGGGGKLVVVVVQGINIMVVLGSNEGGCEKAGVESASVTQ